MADATSHAWGLEGHARKAPAHDAGGGRWSGKEDNESDRKRASLQHKRELLEKYSRCSECREVGCNCEANALRQSAERAGDATKLAKAAFSRASIERRMRVRQSM